MLKTEYAIIKPVKQDSVQGRRLIITTPTGKKETSVSLPKSTFKFSIRKKLDGLLNSGLDYYVDNIYKANSAEEANLPSYWKDSNVWEKSRITKQEYLEIKYNLPPDTLTNKPKFKIGMSRKNANTTYLEDFSFLLENTENRIDLSTLRGEIMMEAAKASTLIANSYSEVINMPNAEFYIAEVNEDAKVRAKKQKKHGIAVSHLVEISQKGTVKDLKKMATLLKLVNAADELSEEALYSKISDYLNDSAKGEANIENFEKYYEMYSSKGSKKIFEAEFFIRELVNYMVLSENKGRFFWNSKGQNDSLYELAKTQEVLIQWILDKSNEPYVEDLKSELKLKKQL